MQNCLEKFTLKAYILLLLRFFCFCFLCYVFACVFFCLLPWWQNHHKICCQAVLLLTDWKKFIKTSKMLQLLLSPFSRQVARYWNQLQACGVVIKQSLGSSVVFFFLFSQYPPETTWRLSSYLPLQSDPCAAEEATSL